MSENFNRKMKEMTERSAEEIEARRAEHPDACEIENFISDELMSEWQECKEKFIKAYYFYQVVPFQEEYSKLDALNNFLCMCYEELRRKIFIQAELSEPKKKIIIVPEKKQFPMPLMPNSVVPNRRLIDAEVDEALDLDNSHRQTTKNIKTMEVKVLAAYFTKASSKEPLKDI